MKLNAVSVRRERKQFNFIYYVLSSGFKQRVLIRKCWTFQACRGNRLDKGVSVIRDSTATDSIQDADIYRIPVCADFLVAYSTVPGMMLVSFTRFISIYSTNNTRDASAVSVTLYMILMIFEGIFSPQRISAYSKVDPCFGNCESKNSGKERLCIPYPLRVTFS